MHKVKMLKGQSMPEDIGMTLIFILLIVGLSMIAFLVYIKLNFGIISGDPVSYSVNFVSLVSRPFKLAEVMSHMEVVDRKILEHSVESIATGSVENANSMDLIAGTKILLEPYKFEYYRVGIESGDNELISLDNIPTRCGEDNKGWCVADRIGCDVGFVEESDPKGICTSSIFSYIVPTIPSRVCCTYKPDEYRNSGNDRGKFDIIPCSGNKGICSEGEKYFLQKPTQCGGGQNTLGRLAECRDANAGKTQLCCAEHSDEIEVEAGLTTQAVVPLLYKNKEGRLEVEAMKGSP